ncbi:hypothetical protein M407DRAFT_84644 [Tulasnella calospora MUT 4182]|uniref:HTH CENPB-type domain-containing protein n=1 Tax=Tulasnella calospora MUT 4182 TaxID=1051891 RepID=A0A0C3PSS6_9AGAM|nr:hypothetical protein M407DRAFT_84644 [Tulasnella calospora MUT 4182]
MIIEKAVQVLEAKTGEPAEVGKHWFNRFMERHPKLATYRAGPLNRIRANAANPVVLRDYADTVERLFAEHKPPPRNILGTDELGDRNNVTVIETICADGTVLRPIVIFKGQYLMLGWGEDNPDDAKIAVSAKGYTDNELGVESIKFIDEQTKDREGVRFLFVDGHGSHCTLEFLDYVAEHNIIVISYPPHLTQWLQGLDVACFGPLKIFWSQEKAKWEYKMRQRVSKDTFLRVYSYARERAFTQPTICSAFRTTGIDPLRRDLLTLENASPAKVKKINGRFPLALPTPAKAIIQAQRQVREAPLQDTGMSRPAGSPSAAAPVIEPPASPLANRTPTAQLPLLRQVLVGTSAEFLITDSPLKSTSRLPPLVLQSSPKSLEPNWSILQNPANAALMSRSRLEQEVEELRAELRCAWETVKRERAIYEGANAQLVLWDTHLEELSEQLAAKETKEANPLKNLMASKTARCMTDSNFRDIKRNLKKQKEDAAKRKTEAEAERVRAAEREKWQEAEKVEHGSKQKSAIAKWEQEAKEAKRLKKKQPKRPAVTKLYPRAPTPDHLKPRKQREAIAANRREQEEQEEIDIGEAGEAGSDTENESSESE